ncbi:cytochrome P450 [Cynara cardunculus var. scolymus]|uniref:Cytochrome P450 n=2 Tax=Cynara cardunculus var. scolymus TaxID=59895 RepID=A0A103XWG9_CYNCS|nr:cytochrome P450 [Cynara cardunculus var. scolymus]
MAVSSSSTTTSATATTSDYGHKSYPFIGSLISFHQNSHRLIHWFTHLLSVSPSQTIVLNRLGRKNQMIVTANPANVEHILKTNFENYPKGKPFTDLLGDFLGMGIFNVDGELWSTQRKLASHEFSTKSLREFMDSVVEEVITNRLIPLLENSIENDHVLDMQDVLRRLAFDTICKISLGWDPCCLDDSRPVPPLAIAFDVAASSSAMRGISPANWVWKMKRLLNVGSERRLKAAVGVVHREVNKIIGDRRRQMDGNDSQRDLLSRFISAGHGDELVRDMVISFLMAGRDTTSAAMTWLLWLLTWHPTVEKEVLDELTAITTDHNYSNNLNFEDLKKTDYLKACLCESMRLYPPVVWDSKHAGKDDVLPDGTPVYKGNRVMYFPYGMGRMEALWGKDCLEFRPDRWFSEPGVLKMESPYKFPVFQSGPRVCLGKEMAFVQMKYVVASILRRFELVPVCLDEPVFVPLLTAHMNGGFKVRVRRRN